MLTKLFKILRKFMNKKVLSLLIAFISINLLAIGNDTTKYTLVDLADEISNYQDSIKLYFENYQIDIKKYMDETVNNSDLKIRSYDYKINYLEGKIESLNVNIKRLLKENLQDTLTVINNYETNSTWPIHVLEQLLIIISFLFLIILYRKNHQILLKKIEFISSMSDQNILMAEIVDNLIRLPKEKENENRHKLVIKIADEINRIEKNIVRMENVKGKKQVLMAVNRVKDNLKLYSYEIPELLGREYNEGMKAIVNFIVNENIDTSIPTITKVIKPQVNYNGEMIQAAEIEVSVK